MGALTGLRVLDLSRVLAGPWASQILADLGADVLKVEHPERGDDTRGWGPPFLKDADGADTSESAYFLCTNRGKRSVRIDMQTEEGRSKLRELALQADILIENFKTGGAARYGLDYESLKKENPRLIYCSITGFGQTGPLAEKPGYDFLVQAMGGLMSVTGAPDGQSGAGPQKVGVALTDIMTGLYATIGILAAHAERHQSGLGQHVDLALLDVTAATLANQASNFLVGGTTPTRLGNAHPNIVPYRSFRARDREFIVAVGNDQQFQSMLDVLGDEELKGDESLRTNAGRVANRRRLEPRLEALLSEADAAHWLASFKEAGVPCGPINTVAELFEEPQIAARNMTVTLPHESGSTVTMVGNPIHLSRTPVDYERPPPTLGQHDEDLENDPWSP
ncbi:MAG: CaiB/BaiF CoA-transferase family protein [Pseudomonadota bacterium]